MKSFPLIALLAAVVFLAFQNIDKQKKLASYEEAQTQASVERQMTELKGQVKRQGQEKAAAERERNIAIAERDNALRDRDTALRERDEARDQATIFSNEIGRLTNSTPKPMTWFEQRQAETGGKLDAPPSPAARVRSGVIYYPQ